MDAIKLIKEDHRTVEGLFKRYDKAGPRAYKTKRQIADRIIKELSVHATIEEQVLYPTTRRIPAATGAMVDEALHEHAQAKKLLRELDRMDSQDERFDQTMSELKSDVLHHAKEEERDMLPQLRKAMGRKELEHLAEQLKQAKKSAPGKPV